MYPERVQVDLTVPAVERLREALADRDIPGIDGRPGLARVHRLLYPVFRVAYEYEDEGGLLDDGSRVDHAVLDGLWTGNDRHLQGYGDGLATPDELTLAGVDLGDGGPGLGETVLLEFQATDERAAGFLASRLADVRRGRTTDGSALDADAYLGRLRDVFEFPAGLTHETFAGVTAVHRRHLPFWLAEYESDRGASRVLRTGRDPADAANPERPHDWLADWLRADPTRLATYGFEVETRASGPVGGDATEGASEVPDSDSDAKPDAEPDGETAAGTDGGASATSPEPVQPDGVDLDAGTLVTTRPNRGFGDVGGMDALKETLRRTVIGPIQEPGRYAAYGIDPVSGVLLYGPPGCGKTYLAGALAGELGHSFVEVSPADLTSKYMGEPARKVADLFAIARANAPCLLFIDELDALAGTRDGDMTTSERQLVNQLLSELEDAGNDDVVVLGATNLVEEVDPAIRRSGRFDERIEVPPPDAAARREIVRIHLAGRPTADDLALDAVVEGTAGYAASDLERVAEEAARGALEAGEPIGSDHLAAAVEATDSSIASWTGEYQTGEGATVVQPDDVDLTARSLIRSAPQRDFGDVGGMADLTARLERRVVEPLTSPEDFAAYGLDVISGLLLYGPPGCGKTYLAEALAGELGHRFVAVTPADLTSKYMGQPASNVADLFAIARANAPCLVFIDELDALAGSRDGSMNASERQLVNQLLAELEDAAAADIVVVGATNLVEDVDPAIRRSGRFDERVEVPPPDAAARREMLDVHLRDRPAVEDISLDGIVEGTAGYAASDLELLVENAARRAFRADAPLETDHLEAALADTESSLRSWDEADRYAADESTGDLRYIG